MKKQAISLIMTLIWAFISICPFVAFPQQATNTLSIVIDSENKLSYHVDERGNRVPDFSYCGYMASESPVPNVPVEVVVPLLEGDATSRIQAAIDYVSSLPLNETGFRGTVLLKEGKYEVHGSLIIQASGVVLRGLGSTGVETVLLGSGNDRETLIRIAGLNDQKIEKAVTLDNVYFPVNSTELTFPGPHDFKAGDRVIIRRPSTKEWIEKIGADKIGIYVDYHLTKWEPGDFDINWDRTVVAVTPKSIVIDAPLTNSLDPQFGGGSVSKYTWDGRIRNVGIENIKLISAWDKANAKDENHRWMAITLENVSDSWVRRVVAKHFVSSAVAVWETAKRITIEDCKSLAPVGEIGAYRRYAFHTLGQQVLFQRCYAEYAYHAFSVGFTSPGPNAFVQCYSYLPFNFSGAIGGWTSGILFDKMTIDGGNISLAFRDVDGQGGGWSAANSLCWQCRAAKIFLDKPPGAQNWAFGSWAQGYGNGSHELSDSFLKPESLYYAQLEARTGKKSPENENILVYDTDRSTALLPEVALQYSEQSKQADLTMEVWIDRMIEKYPLKPDTTGAIQIAPISEKDTELSYSRKKAVVTINNGWIVRDGQVVSGKRERTSLWRGSTRPSDLANPNPNLVRFVPGRIGRGLTDNLDTLTSDLVREKVVVMQNYPALWYERRRDDHARTRRADADVWAPFYEQPFSRSGQGEAFDRLSKYDLAQWNPWYWSRLRKFADLADENGLLFLEEHYLQHNLIEEGAHWVDYPWRSANNINEVGFAENTFYAGDKRVFMAVEFYDTTHVVRNHFHREYIRKSLDSFKDNTNVIHHLGMEYTGPLHFVEFWLDVISEWEKENNQNVLVMLAGTKDVQDAILSDPKRSGLVDIIDILQWQYREDGSLYAPVGGLSLAPRQYARIMDVGELSFDQVYRAVSEYRLSHPGKAVVFSRRGPAFSNWAAFLAGGSLINLPAIADGRLLKEAAKMSCLAADNLHEKNYTLGKKGTGYIVFCESSELNIDLTDDKNNYRLRWINPLTGEITDSDGILKGGDRRSVKAPVEGVAVAWLSIH